MARTVDAPETSSASKTSRASKTSDAPEAKGLGSRVVTARGALESVLAELDPDLLTGADATWLYSELASCERLSVAGKTLLAPRIESSNTWKEGGHKDAASMLGGLEGVSAGQARATLANGRRLADLPATEGALRKGDLSAPKLTELCGAGALDPDRESELVKGAAGEPLEKVKERCRASRATSAARDPKAATKRIRAGRFFSWWTDAEGAFCYQGRDTADRGAKIREHLGHAATVLHKDRRARAKAAAEAARAQGTATAQGTAASGNAASKSADSEAEGRISQRALWADAFYTLVTQGTAPVPTGDDTPEGTPSDQPVSDQPVPEGTLFDQPVPDGSPADRPDPDRPDPEPAEAPSPGALSIITRPPTCTTIVVVDLEAFLRGEAHPGERCEINGQGPIPVPMARDLANDSFLAVLFHRAGDIRAVSHLGRTINASLRTALVYRDRTCVVPGCGISEGLEIDHVIPVAEGGPTELGNLALLCYDHHQLKTYDHWVLTPRGTDDRGRIRWTFEPQPEFGQEPGLGLDTDEGRAEWQRQRQRE